VTYTYMESLLGMTSQWEVLACTSAEWADLMVYGYEIRVCWSERLFSQEN